MKFTLLLFCFSISTFFSQQSYEDVNFRSPIGIPLLLSGNFAELRSNHFHTGLDIKTKGTSGYRVYAIDSGYISRINVSHWGYGLAVYITHPNGYTSVYGHLSKFSKHVAQYVRAAQYQQETETLTLYPDSLDLPVKKGEVFALSGNSGSSMGPHLHFEVRETVSEKPVNPLLFNFEVLDNISPSIFNIKLYPLANGAVNESSKEQLFKVLKVGKEFSLNHKIKAFGEIGFGIHTIDKLNGAGNVCGIYSIELFIDDSLYFFQQMEKLDFSTNRYINTHKDYQEFKKNRRSIHKSFISDNNELGIYKKIINKGRFVIDHNKSYKVKYRVKDVSGNSSSVSFVIQGDSLQKKFAATKTNNVQLNAVQGKDSIVTKNLKVYFDAKTMYNPVDKSVVVGDYPNSLSDLYAVQHKDIPVHKKFVLQIKLKDSLKSCDNKAVIVSVSDDNRKISSKGGVCQDGWMVASIKSFGNYTVLLDTIAPVVNFINVHKGKTIKGLGAINLKISDNLSGIKKYNVFIDDKWILANYYPRAAALKIKSSEWAYLSEGPHKLKAVVEDDRGNITTKSIAINY